jgi:hypothetical protein
MTRKKDKIKQIQEDNRKTKNFHQSRLYYQQQEIIKEIIILKKIQELPDVLIRIIYQYISGNAILFCNYKLDYIEKKIKSHDFYRSFNNVRNLSKKQFLNFINKGILSKFPEIIESIEDFYYCLDINKYKKVTGQHLFNLWEKNRLDIDIYNENFASEEEKVSQIDWSIKYITKDYIIHYIQNVLVKYNINKSRTISQKNWVLKDNILFLNIDKVFYLYKCIEGLDNII